jgi:hypothetical protein
MEGIRLGTIRKDVVKNRGMRYKMRWKHVFEREPGRCWL